MASTLSSDLVLDNELVRMGIIETLEQNVDGFNASSNGTITLGSQALENEFADESFIQALAGTALVQHRDYTDATTQIAPTKLAEDIINSVKLSRRYGPFSTTYDAWNRSNRSVDTFSLAVGRQLGVAISANMLNSVLSAGVGAIQATQAAVTDGTAAFDYKNIVDGLATMGDKAGRIQMLVMHSNTYFATVDKGLSMNALENVGGMTIREGGAYSLGLPVLVTDSAALNFAGNGTIYSVLGLTAGALSAIESDETIMKAQDVLLGENIQRVIQGEGAFNVGVKGCKYDTTAGANPTDAVLTAAANWDYMFADIKSGAGFMLKIKAR